MVGDPVDTERQVECAAVLTPLRTVLHENKERVQAGPTERPVSARGRALRKNENTNSFATVDTGRPEKLADFLSRRSKAALIEPRTTMGWPRRVRYTMSPKQNVIGYYNMAPYVVFDVPYFSVRAEKAGPTLDRGMSIIFPRMGRGVGPGGK